MQNKQQLLGIVLITIGSIFLLRNFIDVPFLSILWKYFWPIALIVIGFQKLSKR
jgi:membrane-bound ClpP family serine protease